MSKYKGFLVRAARARTPSKSGIAQVTALGNRPLLRANPQLLAVIIPYIWRGTIFNIDATFITSAIIIIDIA